MNPLDPLRAQLLEAMQRLHDAHAALLAAQPEKAIRCLAVAEAIAADTRTQLAALPPPASAPSV